MGLQGCARSKGIKTCKASRGQEWLWAKGNTIADEKACMGLYGHDLTRVRRVELDQLEKEEIVFLRHFARSLANWEPVWKTHPGMNRLAADAGFPKRACSCAKAQHDFTWTGRGWHCQLCHHRLRPGRASTGQSCPGIPLKMVAVIQKPHGHRLCCAWSDSDRQVIWCV